MASIQDSAWNSALLNLSRCFSDESMVQTLGAKVLKFRQHEVDSIWNKHKPDANLAAHELLKKFARRYESRRETLKKIADGLCKNDWNQFSKLFRERVEGTDNQEELSQDSAFKIYTLNTVKGHFIISDYLHQYNFI